jgi:hypothetical protein
MRTIFRVILFGAERAHPVFSCPNTILTHGRECPSSFISDKRNCSILNCSYLTTPFILKLSFNYVPLCIGGHHYCALVMGNGYLIILTLQGQKELYRLHCCHYRGVNKLNW